MYKLNDVKSQSLKVYKCIKCCLVVVFVYFVIPSYTLCLPFVIICCKCCGGPQVSVYLKVICLYYVYIIYHVIIIINLFLFIVLFILQWWQCSLMPLCNVKCSILSSSQPSVIYTYIYSTERYAAAHFIQKNNVYVYQLQSYGLGNKCIMCVHYQLNCCFVAAVRMS